MMFHHVGSKSTRTTPTRPIARLWCAASARGELPPRSGASRGGGSTASGGLGLPRTCVSRAYSLDLRVVRAGRQTHLAPCSNREPGGCGARRLRGVRCGVKGPPCWKTGRGCDGGVRDGAPPRAPGPARFRTRITTCYPYSVEGPHFVPGLPHRVERVTVGTAVLRGQTRVPHQCQWLDCASAAAPPCVPYARGITVFVF